MAKKKVSHAHNDKPSQQKQEDSVKSQPMESESPPPSIDSEKLESLKSLNQMLLKEAVERRQQVDSLLRSKGSLETELNRSISEKEALGSELAQLVERAAELEVERGVVAVFVAVQVGAKGEEFNLKMKGLEMEMREAKREVEERESEILKLNLTVIEIEGELGDEREASRRIRVERDDFEDKLNRQIEEDAGLRANLAELGDKLKEIEHEIEESRTAYNAVVRERENMEMKVKSLMREKDLSERALMDSNELIKNMREEISMIVREKEEVEKEKNGEKVKRHELENVVSKLNGIVAKLQKEESKLQKIVAELDKKRVDGEEKLREMGKEIDRLVEEMKLSEKRIQGLVDEKCLSEKDLGEALRNLAEHKREIEGLTSEKNVILDAKSRAEDEVVEMQNRVDELKAAVLQLEGLNKADAEKIRSLESEVGGFKSKLEKVFAERDGIVRSLDEEKKKALKLNEMIGELEKKMEGSHKATEEVKAEKIAILSEKVELERSCRTLKEEITSLQGKMVDSVAEIDSMKSKVELADANSKLVLNMLKGTSVFCSKDEYDGEDENLCVNGDVLKMHAMEIEAIKNAFKSKAAKVEEMKREMELLHSCVVDEQKKKSFWTALSSATTVLAAVSIAYVARGH